MFSGLVGAFSFAIGGTFVLLMLKAEPLVWLNLLFAFLGFLLMGIGLLCIVEEVKPEAKQNPS